ncbi:hypothetical protein IAC76_01385 [Spirochaetes bacterium]|uniref:Uncharacterized protein n=1 Tax=Candidatus Scatousia excrementipullorum TaxID=2840936 RepID=A0A9D9DMX1_9BACT|nr:hypothetical protein [Candidatus Scatousia excrementipullorum]
MENEKRRFSDLSDDEIYIELNKRLKELEAEDYDFPDSSVDLIEQVMQTA